MITNCHIAEGLDKPSPESVHFKCLRYRLKKNKMGSKNGKPVLRPEDAQSLAKTSGLSEEEVKAKFEKFQEEHPKGKMGKRSFRTMMSQALPKHKISKLEAHVFRIYDTNNDGQIDFVEFMIVYYCLSEGTPDQVVRKLFRVFDVNSDGSISYPEMKVRSEKYL